MRKCLNRKKILWLCALITVLFVMFIFEVFFYGQGYPYPAFANISVLDLRCYDNVIEKRGEPHKREVNIITKTRGEHINIYTLHYDDVVFHIDGRTSHVIYLDIISGRYRLGGFAWRSIRVGSTRRAVETDFRRRDRTHRFWGGMFVEFEFDENDVVVLMRMGHNGKELRVLLDYLFHY